VIGGSALLAMLALCAAAGPVVGQEAPATEAELISKIRSTGDTVDPQAVHDLAGFRTRSAMAALASFCDSFATVFMKREVVRALVAFDGVAEAEQPALQKLMDVATQSADVELRTAAIDSLGRCRTHGKDFLRLIIESAADDSLRELAMQAHVKLHDESDLDWYRQLCKPATDDGRKSGRKDTRKEQKKPDRKPDPKKPGKDDKEGTEGADTGKGRPLPDVRLCAFQALVGSMSVQELVQATGDPAWKIRDQAFAELDRRQEPSLLALASQTLDKGVLFDSASGDLHLQELTSVRCRCARIVARIQGVKGVDDMLKRGSSTATPKELRLVLAELVAGFHDEKTDRQLVAAITRGASAQEKLFLIAATRGLQDEAVGRGLVQLLGDKDLDVVIAACGALAERKEKSAVEPLSKMIGKGREHDVMRPALDALAVIRAGDPAWIDELVDLAGHEDPEVRSLALESLGRAKALEAPAHLIAALDDSTWSVRLAALDALAQMRVKDAIGPIVERMAKEDGRMLQDFALTLGRLTGQAYGGNVEGWRSWWKANGERFEFPTAERLDAIKASEEEYRLRQSTHVESKFFGLRIISHRVIFIIDVSGSMHEALDSVYEGKAGRPRMEVAGRELDRCIQGLQPNSFFNILTFSNDVNRWVNGALAVASDKNRQDAQTWVARLREGGGTNLYGAIREAFKDLDVDTIYILSDGEPSVGEAIDPAVIRDRVQAWNEHRGIVIHTISVGGQFQVLEWIAADSGGTNLHFD
jgi:HEAT repeat protein